MQADTDYSDHDNRWIEAESADIFDQSHLNSSNIHEQHKHDDISNNTYTSSLADLFFDPDPYQTFTRVYNTNIDNNRSITIVLKGFKAENGQTLDSTGMTLWRASEILCQYLVAHGEDLLRNQTVLELGAGLGECGILVYKLELAKRVIMSDGDTDVLEQMRKNVDYNLHSTDMKRHTKVLPCRQIIWQKNKDVEDFRQRWCVREQGCDGFDIIMGADIIYTESAVVPLFDTVTSLLSKQNPQAKFLLAYARRNVNIDFVLDHAKKCGLIWFEPKDAEGVYIFSWGKQL